jgi:hypothetical protein
MRGQALVVGHRRKEIADRAALFGVESDRELVLVLACEAGKLAHQLLPLCGEVEGVQAAVSGVAATLDIPTLLELVDVADHAAGHQAQVGAEGLLAAAGLCRDGTQDARVWRGQLDGRELFGEQRGGVKAKLAQ